MASLVFLCMTNGEVRNGHRRTDNNGRRRRTLRPTRLVLSLQLFSLLGRQTEALLKNAGAYHGHQNLIVGNARAFIHCVQTVQKTDNLLLVEKRNCGKGWATKRVLHEGAEFLLWVQRSRRAQERVLLSPVDCIRNNIADGFSEHILFRHPVDFLVHWLGTDQFHKMVIKERYASFD